MSYNWSLQKPFIQGPRPASCNFLDLLPTTFPLLHLLLLQTTFPLLLSPGDNCRGYPPCRVPAIMLVLHNLFADKHFLLVSFVMLSFNFKFEFILSHILVTYSFAWLWYGRRDQAAVGGPPMEVTGKAKYIGEGNARQGKFVCSGGGGGTGAGAAEAIIALGGRTGGSLWGD